MGLQADWKKAKADFERTTRKKKPDTGFFSHATGIDAAFGVLDGVIEKKDFDGARSALATVEKKSDAYSAILARTAASPDVKAGNYAAEVKKLDATLASIVKRARIEVKTLDTAAIAKAKAEAKANLKEAAAEAAAVARAREQEKEEQKRLAGLTARGKAAVKEFAALVKEADELIKDWTGFVGFHQSAATALRKQMKRHLLDGDAADGKRMLADLAKMQKEFDAVNATIDAFVAQAGRRQPRDLSPELFQLVPEAARAQAANTQRAQAIMDIVGRARKPVAAELAELHHTLTESFKRRMQDGAGDGPDDATVAKLKKHAASIVGKLQYISQAYRTIAARAAELKEAGIDVYLGKEVGAALGEVYKTGMKLKGAKPGDMSFLMLDTRAAAMRGVQRLNSAADPQRIQRSFETVTPTMLPAQVTRLTKAVDVYDSTVSAVRESLIHVTQECDDALKMPQGNRRFG